MKSELTAASESDPTYLDYKTTNNRRQQVFAYTACLRRSLTLCRKPTSQHVLNQGLRTRSLIRSHSTVVRQFFLSPARCVRSGRIIGSFTHRHRTALRDRILSHSLALTLDANRHEHPEPLHNSNHVDHQFQIIFRRSSRLLGHYLRHLVLFSFAVPHPHHHKPV